MSLRHISPFTSSFTNPGLILFVVLAISIPSGEGFSASGQDSKSQEAGGGNAQHEKSPKTLLEAITGNQQNTANGTGEPERLDPDRPHLPEASTAVGRGRFLVEGGYTFNERDLSSFASHDYPEALLRVGVLADWFEFFLKARRSPLL